MIKKRQGGGIETEAGKDMAKEKFQLDRDKADLNNDGELSEYEKARGEAVQKAMDTGMENKMAMGGMMVDPFAPFQVTIGVDEHSGNNVPAGSKDEEVRDDIPAMLSEGEYVVPADVVRWHGLKTFEALRGEAKHALGLMAMHDRISFVDDETKEPVEYHDDKEEKESPRDVEDSCPLATQDLEVNTKNRNSAIQAEHIQYGPLNVDEPGTFWEDIAEFWDTSVNAAQKSQCGNCTAFDISPRMLECMPGETSDDDGVLGYCWMHQFKCHSARSCRTWAKGGPIDQDKISLNWQSRSGSGEGHSDDNGVEYEIEEKDKPEVEEAEVKIIKAQEGTDVQPANQTPTSYYQLQYRTNPQTGRTEMVYVDPLTNEVVTEASFDAERASRFAPETVLRREGLMGEEEEEPEEEDECPAGYVKDPDTGMCVPETIAPTPDGGEGRDEQGTTGDVPYSEQLTTLAAERLGGLGADDLADFEGDTLAEQALGRMTDERGVGLARAGAAFAGGPLAMIGLGVKNVYDSIGAKRAAITRSNELQDIASGLDASALPQTYNLTFDPATASFKATTSSRITELQEREGGGTWASDYTHTDREGNEIDPFGSDEDFDKALDAIDSEFDALSETRGGEQRDFGDDDGDNEGPTAGDAGDLSEEDGPEGQGYSPFAKGGMPAVKKNKPRVAMINYSKGNK
jgi:hypothetical protein